MKKPNIKDVEFIITADAADDVTRHLIAEFKRRQDMARARLPQANGIKARAKIEAEVSTIEGILWMLSRLKIEGPLVERGMTPPRWGFEASFEDSVRTLAGFHATAEVPGAEADLYVDTCIWACRVLRDREEVKLRAQEPGADTQGALG